MPNSKNLNDIACTIDCAIAKRSGQVRRVFYVLAFGLTRIAGIECRSGSHGYIKDELRGYRSEKFSYALVTNNEWIRFYIRVPELKRGHIDSDDFISIFPDAEIRPNGEIAYNIHHPNTAVQVIEYLVSCGSKAS